MLRTLVAVVAAMLCTAGVIAVSGKTAGYAVTVIPEDTMSAPAELPLPPVPETLRTPSARAGYVAMHFWDVFDFVDTLRSRDMRFMEQNLVNFISLFPHAGTEDTAAAIDVLMRRAEADSAAYALLCGLAAKYLYERDSPMRDEQSYSVFLKAMTTSSVIGHAERDRASFLLNAIGRNRPGTVASDFAYTRLDGRRTTLMQTPGRRILLMFYDPDCGRCLDITGRLAADTLICRLAASGSLTVLAVYADGSENVWRRTAAAMPDEWIAGLDTGDISRLNLYYMPEMPSLYLLDEDKTVMLRDASPEEVVGLLGREADSVVGAKC